MPPDIEAPWPIDEFERQFRDAQQIVLREFVGVANARPLADVPPDDVEAEFNGLLELLAEHGVCVDFPGDIDIREAYRFVTEELLDEKIDNVSVAGLQLHFIYAEFHPDDPGDVEPDFMPTKRQSSWSNN